MWGVAPHPLPPLQVRNERPGEGLGGYAGHVFILGGESPLQGKEPLPLSKSNAVSAKRGRKEALATVTTWRTEIRYLAQGRAEHYAEVVTWHVRENLYHSR